MLRPKTTSTVLLLSACLLASLSPLAKADDYDQYGGSTQIAGNATGFFHTQLIHRRWWLITPEGHGFYGMGVKGMRYTSGEPTYKANLATKLGSKSAWVEESADRLHNWGLNFVDNSDPEFTDAHKVPFTAELDVALKMQRTGYSGMSEIPDIFGSDFVARADAAAKRLCAAHASDPWLIGYYTDNELGWLGPYIKHQPQPLLDLFLNKDQSAPGYAKATQFLNDRGKSAANPDDRDRDAFLELVSSEYFRIMSEAIKKYDPNHMILGCRFMATDLNTPDSVYRGMKKYVDVESINVYMVQPPIGLIKHISSVTGRPVLVSEFSFQSPDTEREWNQDLFLGVRTETERANDFQAFVQGLANCAESVGWTWFKYTDQERVPPGTPGEHRPWGLVRGNDEPYSELVARLASVNPRLTAMHDR